MRANTVLKHLRLRQIGDAKAIAVRHVEAHAGRDQHVLVLQKIERKRLIVEVRQHLAAHFDEGVQRAHGARQPQILAARDTVEDGLPRLVQTPAGARQLANALVAAQAPSAPPTGRPHCCIGAANDSNSRPLRYSAALSISPEKAAQPTR